MENIPDNIKQLLHFIGLGILGFVSLGSVVKLFQANLIFEGFFTLLVCANLWYLAIKKHEEKKQE